MTKNITGSHTNPEGIPQEGHGGSNTRGTQHQQGQGRQRRPEASAREEIMSSTGNRSNPNETRVAGHREGQKDQAHTNASGKPEIGRQGGATHQETRDHNKHNEPGQSGHKPQKHSPAEEKH